MIDLSCMKIRCALCDVPIQEWYAFVRDESMELEIRAHCHGATDSMRMSVYDIQDADPTMLAALFASEGVAFNARLIGLDLPAPAPG